MNTAALYHRPESEYAYLYDAEIVHLRLRTAKDVAKVELLYGDTYEVDGEKWLAQAIPLKKVASCLDHDYWQVGVQTKYHRLKYAFKVTGSEGETVFFGDRGAYPLEKQYYNLPNFYFALPYLHQIDRFHAPQWVKETVWYQIFPERFANGDKSNDPEGSLAWGSTVPTPQNFFGGDLQGVIAHLDDLQALGINGLYFCPIFKAHSNHKYDTIDYFDIDPAFGDKATFKKLVEEAHRRGMKVMLDAVFNHSGDIAPQWQDVIEKGAASPYKDWYHIHDFPVSYTPTANDERAENLNYDVFAFTPHMPKWNTANPEVVSYLLSIATYWIREFDIDAWRLDVANEVDHHFWRQFHDACLAEKEDFYILGEIWHSAQAWLQGDEFSGVMNYAYCENILQYFVAKEIDEDQLISVLYEQLMLYQDEVNRMNLNMLDSHDTARILYQAQGDKALVRKLLAFMFLQPGSPCLYYGTEVGMTGGPDPLNRACMLWEEEEQDRAMLAFCTQLIALRRQYATCLSSGQIAFYHEGAVLCVERKTEYETIQAFFNQGTSAFAYNKDEAAVLLAEQATASVIEAGGFVILKR